ncbi:MAG: hypothetical protein HY984_02360 [Candidatus Magasanikbacteria bacterium]|nr:hypothetical protein [Candidatus Magasanikbacteria bacterium]
MTKEEDWSIALKKAQQITRQTKNVTVAVRRRELARNFQLEKNTLLAACAKKETVAIEKILRGLITSRAQLTALKLEELRQRYGTVSQAVLDIFVKQYATDCAKLTRAVTRATRV